VLRNSFLHPLVTDSIYFSVVIRARVAESVKTAIKAYEQTTNLPYDSVPAEACRARDGTRSIDLAAWSLLVDDVALRCIAAGDRDRIDKLARQSSVNKVLVS